MSTQASRPLALVTGASSGIGAEIARELAGRGYDLVLVARRTAELDALARELTPLGSTVAVHSVDLADRSALESLCETAASLPIDMLVNNAGLGAYGRFAESNVELEQRSIDVNMTALTRLSRAVLPGMIARGHGQIMNIASTAAFQPGPWMAVYFATKAYVLSLSSALGEELRGSGVTVTAICPGPTTSGFQAASVMDNSGLVDGRKLPTSAEVARYAVKATLAGKPIAIHGTANRFTANVTRLVSRRLAARMAGMLMKPKSREATK